MIRKRRVIAAGVVVAVAAIAACLGPSLSSTEQAAIVVPSSAPIGNVNIGSTGSAMVTIVPASGSQSSTDTIETITKGTCPGWTLMTPGLPAVVARSCTGSGSETTPAAHAPESDATLCTDTPYSFTIAYAPTAGGLSSCLITLQGASFGMATVNATANGVAAPYAMDVTPKMIDFGQVRVGNTGSSSVFVRNTGSNALQLVGITINPQAPYTVGQIGSAISPNVTASTQVLCSPGSAGKFDSTLTVNGGSAGMQSVGLSCTGVMSNLDITPSPADFTTRVNEPSTINVTIQNFGAAATFNTITLDPPGTPLTIVSAPPAGSTLGSGSNATVQLRYAPTAKQTFTTIAKLRINHDNNQMRDVALNGAALETTLEAFPETVDFGGVCAGTTQQMDVDIKGGTEGGFMLKSASTPAAPFTFMKKAGTMVPGNVMPNQGNKLEFVASVTPRPSDTTMMATVTLDTDIPGMLMHQLVLKGEVLAAGVGASPNRIDFGGVPKGQNSQAAKPTVIRNCGDTPITITSASVVGEFQVVSPDITQPITLEPRAEQEYLVIAHPLTAGVKIGSLVLQTGGAPVTVELAVTGVGAGENGTLGERSYYTCGDCNSGPGAGAFAVIVALGLRRRRRK